MNFFNFFENDFLSIFPEIYIFFAIIFLLSYGVIYSTSTFYKFPILSINLGYLAIITLSIAFLLAVNSPIESIIIFNNLLVVDPFTSLLKCLVFIFSILVIALSINYLNYRKINSFEFIILILFSILGIILLLSSYDLISLYLSIELMSLSFYILAAYNKNSEFSGEAGLKYFILGAISSGLLLFGSSLIYGFTGTTNFEDISKIVLAIEEGSLSYKGIALGIFFASIALLFKISASPFHMWAPDVYEGSPTPVTLFFSTIPKLALFSLIIRLFFYSFYDLLPIWQSLFIMSAMVSMVWASLAALSQAKIKRLMAYSGIVNVGYLLMGLASASLSSTIAIILYLVIYLFMTIAFFSTILGNQFKKTSLLKVYLKDMTNLSKTNLPLSLAIVIILFSMIGIPPLAGFFSKLYLFFAAVNSNLYFLAILGVLSSVVAAFYYLRIIKIVFFENSKTYYLHKEMDIFSSYVLASSLAFILLFFIFSDALLFASHRINLFLAL